MATNPPNEQYAVVARNLTKKFGSFIAVDNLSIEVKQGEIFGFLGANGAGKTTAIRMFCGLLEPSSGEASVAGCNLLHEVKALKRKIGYMSQKFSLYDDLSIEQNIDLYGGIYLLTDEQIATRKAELLASVGLTGMADRVTRDLPLGYKQRLALGCSILHRPQVVFLDEPTSGVDPVARRKFWNLIYQIADSGMTVFVTTHYMDEAEYCNRVSLMVAGKLRALDTPTALKRMTGTSSMQDAFLKLVGEAPVEVPL